MMMVCSHLTRTMFTLENEAETTFCPIEKNRQVRKRFHFKMIQTDKVRILARICQRCRAPRKILITIIVNS